MVNTKLNKVQIGKEFQPSDFESIRIKIASSEEMLSWSYGEVTKPETVNYRTQRPERDGLFDERIFGPTKDWECYCGKYKKIRYKGVICDRCGVEVTRSSVRRERMGHIDLVVPVVHTWYIRGGGGVLGLVLDMSISEIESIIYFASFVVLEVNEEIRTQALTQLEKEYKEAKDEPEIKSNVLAGQKLDAKFKMLRSEIESLAPKEVLAESQYHELSVKFGQIARVGIGAEAILELLKSIDIDKELKEFEAKAESQVLANRKKILKRMKIFADMKSANILPEWLVMTRIPVIPPDLRPMVQLDGGRFAASDLNNLYRRVLNRNNRLKKLITQSAPEVICRNEKRMLQESVDALIDNSARRGRNTVGAQRKLKSLSDILRGKQGRFRQNLLGKRVDYSGRSVIVIGPELKLDECGIPKVMALELFKTFVISRLISDGHAHNVKNASKMIERKEAVVWDILEEITSKCYVLLNRAPTLHRLGIQAFKPILVEGKAIQVHPLVCSAFNADFDGDQMAVHVPLSDNAKKEAAEIMLSRNNLLKPASGEPIVNPRLDMVLGVYYLTTIVSGKAGEGKIFTGKNEAIMAWQSGDIDLRAKIHVRLFEEIDESDTRIKGEGENKLVETSVGRILLNNLIPDELKYVNTVVDAKVIKKIVDRIFKVCGSGTAAEFVDNVKSLGFKYATLSGMTISISDIQTPSDKDSLISGADKKVDEIDSLYRRGLITPEEKSAQIIELWNNTKTEIEKSMIAQYDKNNPVYVYMVSGARGSLTQLTQMAGMKGMVVNPAGEIIEIPIKSNFKEGLSIFEYFISSHATRKGRSDTALRTSDAGYLTRRLVDVAQDVVVSTHDCGTENYIEVTEEESQDMNESLAERIDGRILAENIRSSRKKIASKAELINSELAKKIEDSGVKLVKVRSTSICEAQSGVCQACYGKDLGTGKIVEIGTAVGIIAAQAIGEPGTQLTMKTFHMGGVSKEDIVSGLPRVEEIFEARQPKYEAPISEIGGIAKVKKSESGDKIEVISGNYLTDEVEIPADYEVIVKHKELVKPKQAIATSQGKKALRSAIGGEANVSKGRVVVKSIEPVSKSYLITTGMPLLVKNGEKIEKGTILSEGHLNLSSAYRLLGKEKTRSYIIKEIKDVYSSQGQSINDKHLDVIVRQMLSKAKVLDEADSSFLPGQIVSLKAVSKENEKLEKSNKKSCTFEPIVMGITQVALRTDSFLSAASFQETTSVLISAAIRGAEDRLVGLKENVIIGKLIPAGTGFKESGKK
ncbi:DNA-directed RNA polymerase subunit beta' [Candidatus Berkelbacteria bacterium CG10_big_fil_rev_8_21_14_0_10_41_12]|uniref:DNA-directed RNA polymerase subunit beta' n=1 Tax=Candidatus Berkelbacteria bacterium CG10_big_fil_rev_8_21_14_0_10_41_12 TaxID=1974513 RepID=A0A2M6WXX0_9BACT|nr:MAG: DNA-directed RNA polymerase subunit beta' [Candidatus Berkelbacteria bacterium CG10_big_fil_rev_8_21_14_0_10_41_12]